MVHYGGVLTLVWRQGVKIYLSGKGGEGPGGSS